MSVNGLDVFAGALWKARNKADPAQDPLSKHLMLQEIENLKEEAKGVAEEVYAEGFALVRRELYPDTVQLVLKDSLKLFRDPDIAGFYAAADEATFKAKVTQLEQRFARLEARVAATPWFDGEHFSLVDAVFGPVFRYFDVFDDIGDFGILAGKPKLTRWRKSLAARPSVKSAVSANYPALLRDFIERRKSWLSGLQAPAAA